jgi:predicted transposase YbfD/YdcC
VDSKNILEHFHDVGDPREDNRRHLLIDIIAIVICASICGAEKWEDIEAFGRAKEKRLRTFLSLPHGVPSHDTFGRVFSLLDPQVLNERFVSWVRAINPHYEQEIINIDGKTARRSHERRAGKPALHMVGAWANKAGLTLAQRRTDEKSNEITAIPEVLRMLEVAGCVVTIDAMGTQSAIAEQIVDQGGDYVLALKGNQSTLHEDVRLYFRHGDDDGPPKEHIDYHKSVEKDHGRLETRECWATEQIEWLDEKKKWKGLCSICTVKATRTIGEETSHETRHYLSSLPADAQRLSSIVRAHWGVENCLHWVLDIAFREDECRKRKDHSAENFAILRRITLNLLKGETTSKRSIAGKRLLAGWDQSYMEKVLFKT